MQEALSEFGGTLLIVSHDRYLIRRLSTHVWALEEGQLWAFDGGYEEYRAWEELRRQRRQVSQVAGPQTDRERAREARRASEREAARRARHQAELEQMIHQLEGRLAQLEGQLAAASERRAVERVRQLGVEYSQVEAELNTLLAAWTDAG